MNGKAQGYGMLPSADFSDVDDEWIFLSRKKEFIIKLNHVYFNQITLFFHVLAQEFNLSLYKSATERRIRQLQNEISMNFYWYIE